MRLVAKKISNLDHFVEFRPLFGPKIQKNAFLGTWTGSVTLQVRIHNEMHMYFALNNDSDPFL